MGDRVLIFKATEGKGFNRDFSVLYLVFLGLTGGWCEGWLIRCCGCEAGADVMLGRDGPSG